MKRLGIVCAAALAGCLIATALQWQARVYVSGAVIAEAPTYALDDTGLTAQELSTRFGARLKDLSQQVLVTKTLGEMILKLDLYPEELRTLPMEELVERCRLKEIRVYRCNPNREDEDKAPCGNARTFLISFRHKDPQRAVSAAKFLTGQYLNANMQLSAAAGETAARYLSKWVAFAEKELSVKQAALRAIPAPSVRHALDVELLRQHVLRLREKTAGIGLVSDVGGRSIGPRLELLDAATEPIKPFVEWWPALGWGSGAGLAVGLLIISIPFLRRVTLWQATAAMAPAMFCLLVAAGAIYWLDLHPYTSTAHIGMLPAFVPRTAIVDDPEVDPRILSAVRVSVLTQANLANLISNYSLYPRQIMSQPLEALVEQMRDQTEITKTENASIRFTYWGPGDSESTARLVQKVTEDLVSRIMNSSLLLRSERSSFTLVALERACNNAAKSWDETLHATGSNPDRIALDRELARRRYIELKQKSLDARLTAGMLEEPVKPKRSEAESLVYPESVKSSTAPPKPGIGPGPALGMYSPASLPSADTSDLDSAILAASGLFGAIAGLIWKRPRVAQMG